MSFTYDLSATGDDLTVSKIRLEIGDTVESDGNGVKPPSLANFSDAELLHFHTDEGAILPAAARACEILARMWAGAGQNVRIRDYSINSTEKAAHYRNLAADLRSRLNRCGPVALQRQDAYTGSTTEYTS